jgi:hypothetical protein
MRVEIHPIRKSRLVPQCKRCQACGHTQGYCNKEPRCVKCAGKHSTKECKKAKTEQPKCIHCGGNHPASYRGCVVAKEIQKLKNKLVKKQNALTRQLTVGVRQEPAKAQQRRQKINNPQTQGNKHAYAQVTARGTHTRDQDKNKMKQLAKPYGLSWPN